MMRKSNKALFDKKRFEWLEQERVKYLQSLTLEKSVKMMENLISFANELRDNFSPDNPVSLKISLKRNNQ
jgi:hypothetical protein